MRAPALALAIAIAIVGCLAPRDAAPQASPITDALPFPDPMGDDHDHGDAKIHAAGWQMEQTFHHPLAGSSLGSSGAHALDAKAGWLFAASYGDYVDASGGVFIFNLSDPEQPKLTGRYRFPGNLGGDRSMEATEDASFVVLGTEAVDCAGHINPFAPGLYLLDVRDKANPKPVDFEPATGVHSVSIHRIGGKDYVFPAMPGDDVYRIDTSPVPQFTKVGKLSVGHDSLVVDDEILGIPLLYNANGANFEIWDVSDPTSPDKLLGYELPEWEDTYYIHTGAVSFIDGKRILVITSEDWKEVPSAMWVIDATDLSFPEAIANWSAPGEHAADGLRYSMHNPRFDGTVLYLAYYHGGVWSIELADPANPKIVGQFMPAESNGWKPQPPKKNVCEFDLADVPFTFDVEPYAGVVYAADLHTGLYALKPLWPS